MARVIDAAEYLLRQTGPITAMKLQKLMYYSQAWSLVWDEAPLFEAEIQAWRDGPVIRELYDRHKGQFQVTTVNGDSTALNTDQRETIDSVIQYYGHHNAQYLSDLTHMERPWQQAREDLPEGHRGEVVITHASMAEYYGTLQG